ncbi:MAG: T9SS type A sorting domain-containing protein [Sphingobacteriales bacterium]|nr:T9SS type A sorting domain-containing protein [Sphingobacteriales bacterium]
MSAGTYTVTITDFNGCVTTASATVTAPAVPTISSANVVCAISGGTITVTASGTGLTYNIGAGAQASNVFNNVANGTYTVTVTNAAGCTATTSVTVSCVTCPTPVASNNGPVCAGLAVNLSVNPNLSGLTATYSWNGPGGSSTQQNPTVPNMTPAKAGVYTVTVTYSNGCTATATTTVVVNAKPTVTAVASCVSGVGRITVTASGTGLTYNIGTGSQASNVFNNVANGNYTVTVTNAAGCTGTANVTVNCTTCPTPVATNNGPVCTGSAINLSVNPNLVSGVTATYAWSGPAGTSTQQSPVIANATPAKAGTYTVTVTYSNGCTATASTTVVVNAKPTVTAVASCVSGVGRITVTASGTGLTYNIGTGAQASNVFNNVANGTYTVTVTNAAGCTGTANVTVNCVTCATPVASNNGPVCVGSAINLSVNPNLTTGVTATYAWSGPTNTSTLQNPVLANATPAKAGVYIVTVTYSNGCVATASTTVVVNALPTASITANGPLTFCGGGSVTLIASGGGTYTWSNGTATASAVITTAGTYTVTVTSAGGCTATASTTVTVENCCNANGGSVVVTTACPGEPLVATASGYNTAADYAFYYLLVDASGNIVAVNTTGTFATTSLTVGASYTVYGYSVKTTTPVGGPNPPAVGTNVGSITGSCFALSNPPSNSVTIANPIIAPVAGNSSEGSTTGTSPFTYNTTTIEIVGGTAPYNFDWTINGYVRYDIIYTETGATITVYYSDDASWSVTVSDSNTCSSSSAVFSNVLGNVNTLLDIDSYAVIPTNLGDDGSISLVVSGGDFSCGIYQYEWSGPDTWTGSYATTGTGIYTLSGLPTGWYSVTITDCAGNTTEGWYWVPEGSRGRTKAVETLSVMPNPFADKAIVEFTVNVSGNTTVNVYSIDGKQVATLYNATTQAGETYQVTLDGANLPSGMYFVKMTNANGETMLQKAMINR